MGNFQSKAIEKPLERPRKRLKLDLEIKAIEDLPEEIILKIFTQLNIKDLFTLLIHQIEPWKKGPFLILPSSIARKL